MTDDYAVKSEYFDDGVRFGTGPEMIAEIKSLRAELEESRGRSTFLDQSYDGLIILTNKMAGEIGVKDARIAKLEAAILPFARSALSTEPEAMKTRLFSFEDHDAKIQAARDALEDK